MAAAPSAQTGFNTQPPEGGWLACGCISGCPHEFQHTAARRRLAIQDCHHRQYLSRFNTQPPEGGWQQLGNHALPVICFNTQPPEGGWALDSYKGNQRQLFQHTAARRRLGSSHTSQQYQPVSFNTQPPEGGWGGGTAEKLSCRRFQHTAARRRLGSSGNSSGAGIAVSTHSRPKAAGVTRLFISLLSLLVSTHSRPKAAGTAD